MCSQYSSNQMARHHIEQQPMEKTNQDPIYIEIKRRKWGWISHTLRKFLKTPEDSYWNPQKRGKWGDLDKPGEDQWRQRQKKQD